MAGAISPLYFFGVSTYVCVFQNDVNCLLLACSKGKPKTLKELLTRHRMDVSARNEVRFLCSCSTNL